jgi:hypothetical protein
MLGQIRTGIDHRHLPTADDVGAGAEIGEGTGVPGHHTPDQRGQLVDHAVLEDDFADEGDAHRGANLAQGAPETPRRPLHGVRNAAFVSKRLQAVVAALLCLALVQLASAAASHEAPAGVVRVHIASR